MIREVSHVCTVCNQVFKLSISYGFDKTLFPTLIFMSAFLALYSLS